MAISERSIPMRKMLVFAAIAAVALVSADVLATEAAPKDPPVATGGEGLTGNDWIDFGYVSLSTLWYRRDGTSIQATRWVVKIEATNPNFDSDHCRTSEATGHNVTHYHFTKDYGDDFGPPYGTVTAAEGKAYFDWYYEGLTPNVEGGAGPTGTTNCTCYAYHGYKGANTKANYWVGSSGTDGGYKYRDELTEVSPPTNDNSDFDTQDEDRCHHSDHVWVVDEKPDCEAGARKIRWKNNSSGVYTWSHADGDETNDCPKIRGAQGFELYQDGYGIYRK
jgi:hypothetical protein